MWALSAPWRSAAHGGGRDEECLEAKSEESLSKARENPSCRNKLALVFYLWLVIGWKQPVGSVVLSVECVGEFRVEQLSMVGDARGSFSWLSEGLLEWTCCELSGTCFLHTFVFSTLRSRIAGSYIRSVFNISR